MCEKLVSGRGGFVFGICPAQSWLSPFEEGWNRQPTGHLAPSPDGSQGSEGLARAPALGAPGGAVATALSSHAGGCGSDPWSENYVSHAPRHS